MATRPRAKQVPRKRSIRKRSAIRATKYIASFVGFAPVNNPAVVIIVVLDEPAGAYHGGDVAAPVFRQIAEQILPDMGVMPIRNSKTQTSW